MNWNDVPFSERIIDLPSGFSLIWPFRNLAKSAGPYELFLDNNALITSQWFKQLDLYMKVTSTLSPFHALCEQWLSNPAFRNNTEERIKKFIAPFIREGILFGADYPATQAYVLKNNDEQCRTLWMISYLYVILLYRIVSAKNRDEKPKQLLASLGTADVPRFSGCIMLCTLADYLKSNKSIKMVGDKKTAFSYISNFVDLHTSHKNENSADESYLRNRAGDLSFWLFLPMLVQNKYDNAGELVAVTQDKALKKFVFRCLPFVMTDNGNMTVSFDERCFDPIHSENIKQKIIENIGKPNLPRNRAEQLQKLKQLKCLVIDGADTKLVDEAEKVWKEWLTPGFFSEFTL